MGREMSYVCKVCGGSIPETKIRKKGVCPHCETKYTSNVKLVMFSCIITAGFSSAILSNLLFPGVLHHVFDHPSMAAKILTAPLAIGMYIAARYLDFVKLAFGGEAKK